MSEDKKADGRDALGRFVKGNRHRSPTLRSPGRPKKLDSRPILEAIHDEFTPSEIGVMIRQAYDVALKNDDAKMLLEVARFIAAYAIGKPVQRSIKATIDAEEFANLFMDEGTENDHEEEYIEPD